MSRLEEVVIELLKRRWSMLGELADKVYKLPEQHKDQQYGVGDFEGLPVIWVRAPHFFGAVIVGLDQTIVATCPILGRSKGQHIDEFLNHCRKAGHEVGLL